MEQEHLIADSGLQFYSQEVVFNPSSSIETSDGRPLVYHFLKKSVTDEITGVDEVSFDFLCQSGNTLIPLDELLHPQFESECQMELNPSGRVLINESGLPVVKKDANTTLYSTYASSGDKSVFHISSFDSLLLSESATSIDRIPAFKLLLDKWLPVPMFEQEKDGFSKQGPNSWCRLKIQKIESLLNGDQKFRFIWAFDTDQGDLLSDERPCFDYGGPKRKTFSLCNRAECVKQFLFSSVNNGFSNAAEYIIGLLDRTGNANMEDKLKYLGYYSYLINVVRLLGSPVIELHCNPENSVDVSLVLDIGNSRTCGVVFENGDFTMGRSLVLRNLSKPWITYDSSFDMRLTFRKADFGSDIGTEDNTLFNWYSIIRVGEEAQDLIYSARNNDGIESLDTNYSSPKRYLWDKKPYFGKWDYLITEDDPTGVRASGSLFMKNLTTWFDETGNYTGHKTPGADAKKYSRSSLMTFAFVEIFQQAFMYVNSLEYRKHSGRIDCPRRLKTIVITAPTAMPNSEQVTLRKSAADAFAVLRQIHTYWPEATIVPDSEGVSTKSKYDYDAVREWCYDEATASHFVYLYAEINQKYSGEIQKFIEAKGHIRPELAKQGYDKKALTLASIDIGAGTTDLMICAYKYAGDTTSKIQPVPLFWDSFYLAGDDIVRQIIQKFVIDGDDTLASNVGNVTSILKTRLRTMDNEEILALPVVQKNRAFGILADNVIHSVDEKERFLHIDVLASNMIENYFGVDAAGMNFKDKEYRLDFNTQISIPIAHFFMELLRLRRPARVYTYNEIFPKNKPTEHLLRHFENHFGFKIEDVEWRYNPDQLSIVISKTIEPMMRQLSIILDAYHVDALILAGRPMSLDAVTDLFIKYYPVSPDRLVRLNQYHVGRWYPLATDKGYFVDQKSVVAVGAMVAYLASTKGFSGLSIDLKDIAAAMHSTANYMGLYNPDNYKVNNSLLSPTQNRAQVTLDTFPAYIGCKQLNSPEYHARPIYAIRNNSAISPIKVRIARDFAENRELITIEEVTDVYGNPVDMKDIEITAQSIAEVTLGGSNTQSVFWMDNGAFKFLEA